MSSEVRTINMNTFSNLMTALSTLAEAERPSRAYGGMFGNIPDLPV